MLTQRETTSDVSVLPAYLLAFKQQKKTPSNVVAYLVLSWDSTISDECGKGFKSLFRFGHPVFSTLSGCQTREETPF